MIANNVGGADEARRLFDTLSSAAPSAQAFIALAEKLHRIAAADAKVKGTIQFFFRRMLEAGKAGQ